jgi:hypothetical protein
MSGSDLIVVVPWIAFGAGVLGLCIQLLRARRARARRDTRPDR